MNANTPPDPDASELPEPVIRSGKRQVSIVWLVPVVAILIGGWLIYKAISEKGPEITITFNTAEGLEAGKTKIKCKDVEIGLVEEISLSKDLTQVIVKAQLVREADAYLSEDSRFWVVRARVSASSVTGLGTVFSGAYIDIDPGKPGKPARHFAGLEDPPIVTTWEKGRHFTLVAERKGSLDIGSPVYYRQLEVGRVAAYNMAPDGSSVTFKIFIKDPYPSFVRKNSRFWNASGIDVKLDAQGIQVDTESFVSMLVGGLAFDVIETFGAPTEPAAVEDEPFTLYPSREAAREKTYVTKRYYLLHFTTSVRGLSLGAPVEFRGILIGHVVDIKLEYDIKKMTFDIPVIIVIEPGRIYTRGTESRTGEGLTTTGEAHTLLEHLVEKGLRAQLRSGSLVTGQQFVALDFFPGLPPTKVGHEGAYPSIPTMPTQIEELGSKLGQIVTKLEKVPIDQIGNDLRDTMQGAKRITNSPELLETVKSLNAAVKELQSLTAELRTRTTPEVTAALQQAQRALAAAEGSLSADSPQQYRVKAALDEITGAARALRVLAEFLEAHPESLVRGKGSEK
ncbi:MAG: MCE family protein [Deltaproteobacteria bacterium]|nr:MCE family protein [Deltaproteobacteria bacterium]